LEEQREDIKHGRKIKCPIRVYWGKHGLIELKFKAIDEWKKVSAGEVEGEALDSGHYIPEEVPDELLKRIQEFFR
jgi:haloacetate dehalogenase